MHTLCCIYSYGGLHTNDKLTPTMDPSAMVDHVPMVDLIPLVDLIAMMYPIPMMDSIAIVDLIPTTDTMRTVLRTYDGLLAHSGPTSQYLQIYPQNIQFWPQVHRTISSCLPITRNIKYEYMPPCHRRNSALILALYLPLAPA